MTLTTRSARLRGIGAAACVALAAALVTPAPAHAASSGAGTNWTQTTDVSVLCESLGDSYLCDAYTTGFATVEWIQWGIDGTPRHEFDGQWTIWVPCRMGDHDWVLADVWGTDSTGYRLKDFGWYNEECTCHEAH